MIDVTATPADELTWQLLGAYEACESLSDHFAEWCELVGLDQRTDGADRAYRLIHNAYADIWNAIGSGLFFLRIEFYAEPWRARRRGSERAGKRRLVGAFTRALKGGHA